MFVFDLKSVGYEEKEKGQALNFEDLSSVAPVGIELLNLWNDFRKVVKFIDENPWYRIRCNEGYPFKRVAVV